MTPADRSELRGPPTRPVCHERALQNREGRRPPRVWDEATEAPGR